MANGVKLEIVSPERLLVSETAQSVTVPGTEGYFTVFGEHQPLMTTLKPGFITANVGGTARVFFVRGGFADVSPEGLTILAEEAQPLAEFDAASIDADIARAEAELAQAQSVEDKMAATDRVNAWKNLKIEAAGAGATTH